MNEVLASRLLDHFNVPHVPYKLIHATVTVNGIRHETWLSESRDYRSSDERRQSQDTYIELYARESEDQLSFCERRGWLPGIHTMMAFDYLIINRDRHGANVEVTLHDGTTELAPLFDHGLSLIYSCYDDEESARSFPALKDRAVNNYLGSRSLESNLSLIPGCVLQGNILNDELDWLFAGLQNALPHAHQEKIKEIIRQRWAYLIELGIAQETE